MMSETSMMAPIALKQHCICPMSRQQRRSFLAPGEYDLSQRVSSHAIHGCHAYTNWYARRATCSSINDWTDAVAAKIARGKVDTGRCHRSFAQSDRASDSHWVARMAQMDNLRCWPKNTQIAAGVNDTAFNAVFLQCVDSSIDCESLGNSAEVNN